MIKFMMTTAADRKVLGIMISDANVERLKDKQPIHFHAEEMGLSEVRFNEMIILHYPTEEEFKTVFMKEGLITDKTIVHEDKSRKQ